MAQVGYWTNLSSIKLEESNDTAVSTFQAFPYGSYDHPVYGKIDFTPEKADDVVRNFNANARGIEIDIDYDHKAKTGEAAGWVKAAEKRADGLWLTVEWTKTAAQKIKEKAYKYFSPEFADKWKHPKTGTTYKNVLFGGGITNRPFLKDILPLNMSELFAEQHKEKEGNWMSNTLREKLGLPEDATDEQVNAKVDELAAAAAAKVEPPKEEDNPQLIAASELTEAIKKLSEENPAVALLAEQVQNMSKTLEIQAVALKLAETANVVKKLSDPVEGRQLPAVVVNQLSDILATSPKEVGDKIVKLFESFNAVGYVQLGELGHSRHSSDDMTKKFNDIVTKIVSDDKLEYADAVQRAAMLHPEMYSEYRQNSYSFQEN